MKEDVRGTALITGATSGIGYALSRRFAGDRYNLVMVARDARRLAKISEEFRRSFAVETHWISKDWPRRRLRRKYSTNFRSRRFTSTSW